MTSKKLFLILSSILTILAIVLVGLFVFGDRWLKSTTAELKQIKIEAYLLEQKREQLVDAKEDIEEYSEVEQIAKTVVPQEKDQARTIREIIRFAEETGISISSITFPSSTLGEKSSGTTSNTQTQKVDGITGVERLEVTVQASSESTYGQMLSFLDRLEQNRRTSQVSSITVTPNSENRDLVSFGLILNVYIKK